MPALNIVILALFYSLWRSPSLNGTFIYKVFFGYYGLYLFANGWHLLGRLFFPETLTATYYFSTAVANVVFILVVLTLGAFGVLKFLDRYAEGGLMGVYSRNISQWRKWLGGKNR